MSDFPALRENYRRCLHQWAVSHQTESIGGLINALKDLAEASELPPTTRSLLAKYHQILRANQAPPDPTQWLLTLGRLDRLLANENAPATTHDPAVWEKQSTHMPAPKKNIGDAQIHPGWILAEPPSLTTSPTALCHWIDVGAVMPVCLGPELLQAVLDPASSCVEPTGKMTKESDRAPGLWVGPGVVWQDQTLAGVCLVDPAQLRPTLGRCICVIRAPATALTQRTHFGVIATKLPTPITLQQVEKDACLWLDWAGIARSIDGMDHF